MTGAISEWKLSPEQLATYHTGKDLGKPDRVYQPEPMVKTPHHQYDPTPNQPKKKNEFTKEEYLRLREKGLDKRTIAVGLGIGPTTLNKRLKEWGIKPNG
ncbi:hypothetical protein [Cohnella yongneupensis]|uniref:DNA binding HTH domain-containing protein n=1 Tax=Cohnella yongneupensis TaxID=425006 RepID=A0ABW0QUC8_9BACL